MLRIKNLKKDTLNTKVNNLENKIPDAFTLIETSQCLTWTKFVEKIKAVENEIPDFSGLATAAVLNANIGKVENKILNSSCLATAAVFNRWSWDC